MQLSAYIKTIYYMKNSSSLSAVKKKEAAFKLSNTFRGTSFALGFAKALVQTVIFLKMNAVRANMGKLKIQNR